MELNDGKVAAAVALWSGLLPRLMELRMKTLIESLLISVLARPRRYINAVSGFNCSLNSVLGPSHVSILLPPISFLRVFQRNTRFLKMLLS